MRNQSHSIKSNHNQSKVRILQHGFAIVVDIGKTHSKLSLWSRDGHCLEKLTRANQQQTADGYAALDCLATQQWLLESLGKFAHHPVTAIVPVAHGAAVAGICDGQMAFVPPDYEWEMPSTLAASYRQQRGAFAETGSPALPNGLNFGAQLHMLETRGLLQHATLMPYAQFWGWWLSGNAVSELTSLGCHSDLWAPARADYSDMAKRRGWADQFAPLARARDVIGTLRPELAAQTGLSSAVKVYAGLHDSNAALVAARGFAEVADHEATVLSTGTWFIAMRSPKAQPDLAVLPEAQDCLVNVDVAGQAVPSARWMGGREIDLLAERVDQAGLDGLTDILASQTMILPSNAAGCGPFPHHRGAWLNRPANAATRRAAIALYAALMTDTTLDLIGAKDTLLIEGRFAASELFTRALATLRPDTKVYISAAEADVSFGALRMIEPGIKPSDGLQRVSPLDNDLTAYKHEWHNKIKEQDA